METYQPQGLKYFSFDNLKVPGLKHGIFSRHGGVSPAPWNTLNLGGSNGDERKNVIENRRRVFDTLGLNVHSLFDVWQVHSADVICTDRPRLPDEIQQKADAIITDRPGISLFMRFGDCVPILLHDPERRVIAMVHAGWQGTVKKVVKNTIHQMISEYACEPQNILAGIGPSVAVHHYEVGPEVLQYVKESFPIDCTEFLVFENDRSYFDLWKANAWQMMEAGIENIEVSNICTVCHKDTWFSHRGDRGMTGRFGAVICMD